MISFDILPKSTSMMASVSMSNRQVLSVKMMIIFFQKLSCTNQFLILEGSEIFLNAYFIVVSRNDKYIVIIIMKGINMKVPPLAELY